ncbi:MAG TPA: DUF2891 family protein [Amycolatopsis sp.]|nr:DUF2891 family protein [Amycolatopsis sp.]
MLILSPRLSHPCFYGGFDWHSCAASSSGPVRVPA